MSTSLKHRNFVSEPMGNKLVTELPGVGPVLGRKLADVGYSNCSTVLGQFLVMNRNEESFKVWFKRTCGANSKQANDCCQALKSWTENYI